MFSWAILFVKSAEHAEVVGCLRTGALLVDASKGKCRGYPPSLVSLIISRVALIQPAWHEAERHKASTSGRLAQQMVNRHCRRRDSAVLCR